MIDIQQKHWGLYFTLFSLSLVYSESNSVLDFFYLSSSHLNNWSPTLPLQTQTQLVFILFGYACARSDSIIRLRCGSLRSEQKISFKYQRFHITYFHRTKQNFVSKNIVVVLLDPGIFGANTKEENNRSISFSRTKLHNLIYLYLFDYERRAYFDEFKWIELDMNNPDTLPGNTHRNWISTLHRELTEQNDATMITDRSQHN